MTRQLDALLLSETWREAVEEQFETNAGHLFMASGGSKREKGAGILLHSRWKHAMQKFQPLSQRICCASIDTGEKKIALIAIYMPHGGRPDSEVEQTYVKLS